MLASFACKYYLSVVNSKQKKILDAVFRDPVSGTIPWSAIENLFLAVGCERVEGSGSRVRFVRDNVIGSFHRPHPNKEAKRYQVREAREFLMQIGVTP